MAILCSLTRAAVKLLLFQENDLSYSIQPVITIKITDTTQGVGQKQLTIFHVGQKQLTIFHGV